MFNNNANLAYVYVFCKGGAAEDGGRSFYYCHPERNEGSLLFHAKDAKKRKEYFINRHLDGSQYILFFETRRYGEAELKPYS
jgi:hypothetical protein